MKSLKAIMAIVAVAAAFALTSCNKENKDEGDPFSDVKTGWTESGNKATYKAIVSGTKADDVYNLYYLFTITHNGETVTSVKWELGCPNAEIANEVIAELKAEPDFAEVASLFSVKGRIISVDLSSLFAEIPYSLIKEIIESLGKQDF